MLPVAQKGQKFWPAGSNLLALGWKQWLFLSLSLASVLSQESLPARNVLPVALMELLSHNQFFVRTVLVLFKNCSKLPFVTALATEGVPPVGWRAETRGTTLVID